ncbi:MAG: SurA N-terminal domain-containing protein, partial [Rickettsiales bacterium]|nr:SurA N-terminal domain-containing protein [Rickettsiales bacterium]
MRKKFLNSGATKFLLGILIVAFVLSSISGILFMSNRYNILVIGDEKVNINTFVNIINNEKQTVYQRNPTEEQIKYLDSEEFLLETVNKVLITKLIGEEIKDYKFDEPEEIILSKIASEKSLFTNGKFDVKKFNDTLAAYNITENLYIKALQEQDSRNAFLSSFADVVDV